MKSRLLLLALPLFFFACEADDDEAIEETTTLVGLWTVTAYDLYSGSTCTGTPVWGLDSLTAMFGDDMSLSMEFTEDAVSFNMNLSADAICSMMGATIDGDSCLSEYGNLASADVCVTLGGTYANSTCTITDNTSDYTTEDDAITITTYAGTDSAEVASGNWAITNNVLTLTVVDDSNCANYTLSK